MKKVLYFMMAVFAVMSFMGCSAVQNAKSMAVNMGLSDYKFENVGNGSMRESMVDAEVRFLPVSENKTLVPAYIRILSQPRYTMYAEFLNQRCEAKGGKMTITGPIKKSTMDGQVEQQRTFPYDPENNYVRKILNIEYIGYNNDERSDKTFEVTFECTDNKGTVFSALMRGGIAYGGFRDDSLTLEYYRYIPIMVTTREKQPDMFYPFPINEQLDQINDIDEFFEEKFAELVLSSSNKKYWLRSEKDGIYKVDAYFSQLADKKVGSRVGYADIPEVFDALYDLYYLTETKSQSAVFKTPFGNISDQLMSYFWINNGRISQQDYEGYYGITGDPDWAVTFKYEYNKEEKEGTLILQKGFDESRLASQEVRPLGYTTWEKEPFQLYEASKKAKAQAKNNAGGNEPIPNSVTSLNKQIAKNAASNGYVEKINGTLLYQGVKTGTADGCDTVGIIKKDGDDVRSKKNFRVCDDKVFALEETTTEEVSTSLRMLAPRVVANCNLRGEASLSKGSYTVKCKQPNPNQAIFEMYYIRDNLLIGYEIVK